MFRGIRRKHKFEVNKIGKRKKITIVILCLIVIGLTIGYATFYSELNISPYAIVRPNQATFSVLFSKSSDSTDTSGVVPTVVGDVEASTAKINNNGDPTISRMNIIFSEPGQSVTYTFYARNVGEYKAFLNNVIFENSDLGDSFKVCSSIEGTNQSDVDNACNYIKVSLEIGDNSSYTETEKVSNHELDINKSEKIVLTVSYDANDNVVNGDFTVDFGLITLVYSTIGTYDGNSSGSDNSSSNKTLYNAILLNEAKTSSVRKAKAYIADKGTPNFSNNATSDEGVYSTTDEDGTVYYFRGAVDDNHVIFANFCWRIVRTTGTKGVKLIYDGSPVDGVCNNTGSNTQIKTSQFNSSYRSPAYVGYMYGQDYIAYEQDLSSLSGTIVYGNDVTFDEKTGKYTLVDTIESDVSNWESDYTTIGSKYHYTCWSNQSECMLVSYMNAIYTDNKKTYYFNLTDGKTHTDILKEMLENSTNEKDSVAKSNIDSWYKSNLIDYTNKLEDTVWCNDRTISSYGGWDKDKSNVNSWLYFSTRGRLESKKPSLLCNRLNDKFTVNLGTGNGDLKYPVGLITGDEISYAGGVIWSTNASYYLYTGQYYWSGSPSGFDTWNAAGFTLNSSGNFSHYVVTYSRGLRPAVSLKSGTTISGGDGSSSDPYIVS
jgi:hypothetical protein